MDVAVTELRAHLSAWVEHARTEGAVVITDHGIPVARLVGIDSADALDRLAADGVISRATASRPKAAGRAARPKPRRPVSDRVGEQRR
jgi:prevent-host-death family protein